MGSAFSLGFSGNTFGLKKLEQYFQERPSSIMQFQQLRRRFRDIKTRPLSVASLYLVNCPASA